MPAVSSTASHISAATVEKTIPLRRDNEMKKCQHCGRSLPSMNYCGRKTVTMPTTEPVWPTLTAVFPMDRPDWDYMMDVLEEMRPSLTAEKGG